MIKWSELDPMPESHKCVWREYLCPAASRLADGACLGYSIGEADDEPCDVCKACDKLSIEGSICSGSVHGSRNVTENDVYEELKTENARLRKLIRDFRNELRELGIEVEE